MTTTSITEDKPQPKKNVITDILAHMNRDEREDDKENDNDPR